MKSPLSRPVLLAALFWIASAALAPIPSARAQQTPPASAEEPNNTFGAALPITLGQAVDATLTPQGDVDWFTFEADQQGELALSIVDVPQELDMVVRVWNSEKETVSNWLAPLAVGGDTTGVVDLPEPGVYFLEVGDGAGDASSTETYTLLADFTPTADDGEPNNRFGDATPLPQSGPIQANLLPANDADWYRIETEDAGQLDLTIDDVAEELAISVRVWNSERETIGDWASPLAPGGATTAQFDLPTAGVWFLEVAGGSGQRSPDPYTLDWTFTPAGDATEPNNRFGTAAALDFAQTYTATLLPRGDADWYRIDVPGHGELSLALTGVPEALDLNLRVWNSNKETVSDWFAPLARGGDTLGQVDLPGAGIYYLETVDGGGDARAVEPYSIAVDFAAAADPFEPNNRFGKAGDLSLGEEVDLNILPRGDVDWLALSLPHHGELRVDVTNVPEDLDVSLRLWNANKETASAWFTPLARGGDTEMVVDVPQAGRYLLEVADGNGDARSIDPFTLGAEFAQAADQGEPNNAFENAIPLDLDATIAANILPANDADWYRVEVAEIGDLHLLATNVPVDMALALRVWNEARQTISNWALPLAPGGDSVANVAIAEPGVYFVEVVDDRRGRSIQPYWLVASMSQIDPAAIDEPELPTESASVEPTPAAPAETAGESEPPAAGEDAGQSPTISASETPTATSEPAQQSASGGRKPPPSQADPSSAQDAPDYTAIALELPEGWLRLDGDADLRAGPAENAEDLRGDAPIGPRVRIVASTAGVEDALAALEQTDEDTLLVLGDPFTVTLGDLEGVAIDLEESADGEALVRRYIFLADAASQPWQIILEAPQPEWEDALPVLEEVLGSIRLEGGE